MSDTPSRASTRRPATAPASAAPRSTGRFRWGIGILLGVGVLINYFDRVNLSVAGSALSKSSA
jgi:hypothetical protein